MRVVREQQLLQEEEGPLVGHPLSNLDHGFPRTLSVRRLAVLALLVSNRESHHYRLLQYRVVHHLLLHRQLYLQTQAVRLSPNPNRINQFHFVQSTYFSQASRHQLLRL